MAEGDRRGLALILLPWLAPPLVAGAYLAVWERPPERVAVQFDMSSGAAANWMSRGTLLGFDAGVLFFVLAQYTFKLLREPSGDSRRVVVSYYAVVVLITAVFLGILVYNLS